MQHRKTLTSLLLTFSLLAASSPALPPQTKSLLSPVTAEAAKSKKIKRLSKEVKQTEKDVKKLTAQLLDISSQLSSTSNEISRLCEQTRKQERKLTKAKKERKELREDLKEVISFLYKNKIQENTLPLFLGERSFAKSLNYQSYVAEIMDFFYGKLDDYQKSINTLRAAKEELLAEKAEQKKQEEKLSALSAETQKSLSNLSEELKAKKAAVKEAERQMRLREKRLEEKRAAEEERKRLAAEQARLAAAAAANQTSVSSGNTYSTGEDYTETSAVSYSDSDLALLAAIIQAEAGNQPYAGKVAVGSVVMNRVQSSRFPNTIPAVVYQSGQFTPASSGRLALILAQGAQESCRQAARDVLAGKRNVDKLYFKSVAYARAHGITGIQIGGHIFH